MALCVAYATALRARIITLCKIAAFGAGDADARGAALCTTRGQQNRATSCGCPTADSLRDYRAVCEQQPLRSHTSPRPPTPKLWSAIDKTAKT
ncbi:MAG: hypothetical protein LBI03_03465 [Clostridiales bacterium]|nr:hypothetical protein [Clostridiales bacterium]